MKNKIHLAIQIVPLGSDLHPYRIIDKAIQIIAASGLRYEVGPMETVIEGTYDEAMHIAKKAQQACLDAGATEIVTTIKLHIRNDSDITWDEKMKNYGSK